ncbi:C-type lectin domain family 2 member B-like isoform X2 [Mustela lutreola]|uniref:C-type lectin domain family 2 member B n=2 Tax=Mustela putorius furo TaxID=9669 RepID=M3Y481_MUSPF|nr:C-type lectin domain family 2 member B isoform X3 [Mustela putorius furo]XP_059042141.1 C-type lectin domain family 2 member B-like isoform X2 [Mustela lutreola]
MTQSPLILTQTDHRNQGTDEKKQGLKNSYKKILICILLAISFTVINIVITGIGLVCKNTQDSCPDDWIGFQKKCYYFSKEEQDWNSSRHNCVTQHADLTMIDTDEEMGFLKRYKCTSDHWIGLEMTENQTGRWVKGTIFNKRFPVRGSEKCAYLDDNGAATARCYTERKWICRRKMH